MQVIIKYTDKFKLCAGGIETLNTPLIDKKDSGRAHFAYVNEIKKGAFVVEQYVCAGDIPMSNSGGSIFQPGGIKLIADTRGNKDEYFAGLNKFVEGIEVDGHIIWENVSEKEEPC